MGSGCAAAVVSESDRAGSAGSPCADRFTRRSAARARPPPPPAAARVWSVPADFLHRLDRGVRVRPCGVRVAAFLAVAVQVRAVRARLGGQPRLVEAGGWFISSQPEP